MPDSIRYHHLCIACQHGWNAESQVPTCPQCAGSEINVNTLICWPSVLCGAGHDRLMRRLSKKQKKGGKDPFDYWAAWLKEEVVFVCSDCHRPTCKEHAFRKKVVLKLCVTCKQTQKHRDEGGESGSG